MKKPKERLVIPIVMTFLLSSFFGSAQAEIVQAKDPAQLDVIIRGGTILDGSGKPRYTADIGVKNGYIYQIGDLKKFRAEKVIDAKNSFVAPGFIDIHSHADTTILNTAGSSLYQGVTTEIVSPDGGGPVDVKENLALEKTGLGINIGTYIGFNSVWKEINGESNRRPTSEEIEKMQELIQTGLKEGAWGVSAGLFYTPGNYATREEVIEVAKAAKDWRTIFPNHIRNENNQVVESVQETIDIGEKAGLVPVVTHMKVMGPNNWGKSSEMIKLIQDANQRGTYAAADQYPYLASQTGLTAIVPPWVQDGGTPAMLERFANPELRPKIEKEIETIITSRVKDANDVYFPTKQKTLAAFAEAWGVTPGEATMRILKEEGNLRTIYFFGHEDDFKRILQNPTTAIASDGGASDSNETHPRHYGTQPRLLGKYVREEGYITWEEAILKMTGLPASLIGIVDRGFIAEGMVADITVLDPNTVIDKATFEQPKQYAEGIKYVLVNGKIALQDGQVTQEKAGKALIRTSNMPSRPVSFNRDAKVKVQSEGSQETTIDLSIHQNSGDLTARGSFKLVDRERNLEIQATRFGKLQTTKGWSSFTGRGKVNNSKEEKQFLVIVEQNDPFEKLPTITVKIEDIYLKKSVIMGKQLKIDP